MEIPKSKPISELDNAEIIVLFKTTMDYVTRTNNAQSLIDLARHASDIWTEMEMRGLV